MSGNGRLCAPLVRRGAPGPDGVPDQEAASRGRDAMWEREDLPAGQVCGQNQEKVLFSKCFSCHTVPRDLRSEVHSCDPCGHCHQEPLFPSKIFFLERSIHNFLLTLGSHCQ